MTERILLLLLLAATLGVLAFAWPWSFHATLFPLLDISGYVLKSWATPLSILLLLGGCYLIVRRAFFR